MKKIISFVVVLMLVISSFAIAEGIIDVSQYTLDELILIRAAVEQEISNRVSTATAMLMPGKYTTGVDIAAGSYIIIGLMDEAPNGYTPQALVAATMEDANKWDYIDNAYVREGEKWRVTLQDGMVLEIRYAECTVQQEAPFLFAPK